MAASLGTRGGITAEINVTPMIDVLLVLLVVFMVLQRGMLRGLDLHLPPSGEVSLPSEEDRIVLRVGAGGELSLNSAPVAPAALEGTLMAVYTGRPGKVLFVSGAEDAAYREVLAAVDAARAAGVEIIGVVPRRAP